MGANSVFNAFRRRVLGRREVDEGDIPINPLSQSHSCPGKQQLIVYLADRNEPLRLDYRPEQTVRDVCEEIAKELKLSPLALPFFTLVSRPEGHLLNQQKKLSKTECEHKYDFKLAFKACRASRFKQPDIDDINAIKYLFHQSRQEFLQHKITFPEEEKEDKKNFVKLVVLELIYKATLHQVKPQKLVDDAKQYSVTELLRRDVFRQYGIREVKKYIKTLLPNFQKLPEEKLMLEYLHVVEQSENFFVFTFTVYKQFVANGRNHNVQYELLISPQFGIKKKEVDQANQSSQVAEVIVKDFSQVCGLEIEQTQSNQVIISRMESKAEVLSACSPQDAQSIVAIINGYYRLLVNRYRNLNGLQMPLKFHGPISREMSMSILQARGEEDGLFLIRQSRRVFNNYVLSLMYDKSIKHYEIIKDDGLYMLKDTTIVKKFKNLDAFIKYYKENQDGLSVCLKNNCLPSETDNDALLNSYPLVPVVPRPQDLNQFGLESINTQDIKLLRPIGKAGEFGNVILSEWTKKKGENPLNIAVRKLKKKLLDESFFDVEKRLIKLKNVNIIRHYGLSKLKDSVGLITEYAPDNLETYLKNAVSQPERKSISKKSVILFAAQIAEGMMYLKDMKCVHGRLKAHNILVATDEQIKIGDIGLIDLKNHGGEFMGVDHASAGYCWQALEMLVDPNNTHPTHESDVWSLGVTMWEMFALKRPFHSSTSSSPLPREEILKRYHRKQYLSTQRENLPEAVAVVIQKCWNPLEEDRISFSKIVTALRSLIIRATAEESMSYSHELILEQKTEDWEKPIKQTEEELPSSKLLRLITTDSYSMMAPNEDNNHPFGYTLNTIRERKTSLHRTFSDPGSPTHVYEETINENLLALPQHTVSLTRTSSYPQSKFFTQQERCSSPTGENVVANDASDEKKARSFTQQAPDCMVYHGYVRNTTYGVTNDDRDNELRNDSPLEEDQPTMDVEDEAMEFLKTKVLKLPFKQEHLGVNDKESKEHDRTNLEQTEHKEKHDSAMDFLGSIMRQKRIITVPLCTPPQQLPWLGSTTGQYVPHSGVSSPLQPGSTTTGQYVPHLGVSSPLQPGSTTTGQYVPHSGVSSPLQPGSTTTGQYVPHLGVSSPLQPDSTTTGQYVHHSGVSSPLQPGSTTTGQYVPHLGFSSPLQPGSTTTGQYVPHSGSSSPLQPGSTTTGQYVPHLGVSSPLQPGSTTTGQYVPHSGSSSPLQPGSTSTGQYVPHSSVSSPLQPGSTTTGQYVPHSGFSSPLQPGSTSTGQYVPHSSVSSPLQPGSSITGQYQEHCGGVSNIQSGNSTASLISEKHTLFDQGLEDFVMCRQDSGTESTSLDQCETGDFGSTWLDKHGYHGYIEDHSSISDNCSETSVEISSGWSCDVPTVGCSNGYTIQAPMNTSPVQENTEGRQPMCEVSASSSLKLDLPVFETENVKRIRLKELQEKINKDFIIEQINLSRKECIGEGNFGIVRRGVLQKYVKSVSKKEDVAVKELLKCPGEPYPLDDFITEAINMQELKKIKNINIVTPIGICLDTEEEVFMIVTELAPLGPLHKYLKEKKERIGVHKLLEFCLQIANGMRSLEDENVLHRDLALRNILVAAEDQVKISDFGLSRLSDYYKAKGGKWPIKWYAPESLKNSKFTTKSDVWSFGITVWEMFHYGEKKPYDGIENGKVLEYILEGNRLPKPDNCPEGVYEIMLQCWDKDSKNRPTFFHLWRILIPDEINKLPKDETIN